MHIYFTELVVTYLILDNLPFLVVLQYSLSELSGQSQTNVVVWNTVPGRHSNTAGFPCTQR